MKFALATFAAVALLDEVSAGQPTTDSIVDGATGKGAAEIDGGDINEALDRGVTPQVSDCLGVGVESAEEECLGKEGCNWVPFLVTADAVTKNKEDDAMDFKGGKCVADAPQTCSSMESAKECLGGKEGCAWVSATGTAKDDAVTKIDEDTDYKKDRQATETSTETSTDPWIWQAAEDSTLGEPCAPETALYYPSPDYTVITNYPDYASGDYTSGKCVAPQMCKPDADDKKWGKRCKKAAKNPSKKCKNKKILKMCQTACSKEVGCVVADDRQVCKPDAVGKRCKKAAKNPRKKCKNKKIQQMCQTTCSDEVKCKPYDCDTKEVWSAQKIDWCCAHENKGCLQVDLYNCYTRDLPENWSAQKKEWCCAQKNLPLGCVEK